MHMILSSNTGWTVAMRKILVIVFGGGYFGRIMCCREEELNNSSIKHIEAKCNQSMYNFNKVIIFFIFTDLILRRRKNKGRGNEYNHQQCLCWGKKDS